MCAKICIHFGSTQHIVELMKTCHAQQVEDESNNNNNDNNTKFI